MTPHNALATAPSTSLIQQFPPELLLLIFSISSDEYSSPPQSYLYGRSRYECLRSLCLTCRAFVEPAKVLLWELLVIGTDGRARSMLASLAMGKYATKRLNMTGKSHSSFGVSKDTAERVLRKIGPVKEVDLVGFLRDDSLRFEALKAPSLSSLKFLHLRSVNVISEEGDSNSDGAGTSAGCGTTIPYSLQSLTIRNSMLPSSPNFSASLFGTTLQDLNLEYSIAPIGSYQLKALLPSILSVAPKLNSFSIHDIEPILDHRESLCTSLINLQHLRITCSSTNLLAIARLLPSPLLSLQHTLGVSFYTAVRDPPETVVANVVAILGLPCAKVLEELTLLSLTRPRLIGAEGGPELMERMGKRRITVRLYGD